MSQIKKQKSTKFKMLILRRRESNAFGLISFKTHLSLSLSCKFVPVEIFKLKEIPTCWNIREGSHIYTNLFQKLPKQYLLYISGPRRAFLVGLFLQKLLVKSCWGKAGGTFFFFMTFVFFRKTVFFFLILRLSTPGLVLFTSDFGLFWFKCYHCLQSQS